MSGQGEILRFAQNDSEGLSMTSEGLGMTTLREGQNAIIRRWQRVGLM